jgi:hypothetical protein
MMWYTLPIIVGTRQRRLESGSPPDSGAALEGSGRLEEAEATLRKTLELRRKVHGDLNSTTQRTIAFLARLSIRRANPDAAELFRELMRLRRGRKVYDPVLDRDLDSRDAVGRHPSPPTGSPCGKGPLPRCPGAAAV